MLRLTASAKDCLKTVYHMDPRGKGVRIVDLSNTLSVTVAGAARAVTRLEEKGLARRIGKTRVCLTAEGQRMARDLKSRYEVVRLFFVEVLCVNSEIAKQEAGKLEHILTDSSVYAMKQILDENSDWIDLQQMVGA